MREVAQWERRAAVIVAVVVVALAALRATYGFSFFDDSYYVVVPLRLALGARVFVDDAALQPLGSLLAVPFVALWHAVFGLNGIVLASRLFYVVVATIAGFFTVRALKPSFGPLASVVAVSAILIAPPYQTFALSYNTVAQLAFVPCIALVLAAWRDHSRGAAASAGVLAAIGCVSYPPLALAALPAAVVAAIVLRRRRLWLWLVGGALVVLAVAGVTLAIMVPVADIMRAFKYSTMTAYSGTGTSITVAERAMRVRHWVKFIVTSHVWWPAIGASFLLSVGLIPGRIRGWLAALLPILVALPAVRAITHGVPWTFGVPTTSYFLAFALSLIPLTIVAATRRDESREPIRRELKTMLLLGASFSVVATPLLLLVTSSGFVNGVAGVGAAPFALAAVIAWLWLIGEWAGKRVVVAAVVIVLAVEVALLFGTAFRDVAPLQMDTRVTHGAVAGIRASAQRAGSVADVEQAMARITHPGSRLLVVNAPLVYLLTDAEPTTYATWVNSGPADQGVIDYFVRTGVTPDFVAVSRAFLSPTDDSVAADPSDPLMRWITRNYTPAERAGYVIFRRR